MFSDLSFDSRRHLYYLGSEILPSVSKKVADLAPKFNAEKILPYSARKQRTTVPILREQWNNTRDVACAEGTETHTFAEEFNGMQKPLNELQRAAVKFFLEWVHKNDYVIIAKECRVYSGKYRYAGTFDLLLQHRYTGKLLLIDYKTNKDLFKSYDYLLPPFTMMEDTPFNKYQLQLSFYRICLQEMGIDIDETYVVWFSRDGRYEILDTSDFTEELKDHMTKQLPNVVNYRW